MITLISACILIRTASGQFDKVVEEMKQFEGVKKAFAVLGRYDVVVDLEADDYITLSKTALRMGMMAGVVFTETLIQAPMEV
ncbi:Lrp/AsnC ligand binding domain-containing protein [[Eubacterium] cellulosolvens]